MLLAAGASERLGSPKQLVQFEGESLLRHTVRAAVDAGCAPVLVVLGANAELCQREVVDLPARVLQNEHWNTGMASSIRCGIRELDPMPDVAATILLVCDQPHVTTELLQRLMAHGTDAETTIVASHYANTLGVPALFARVHFPELLALAGDLGAKSLFTRHKDRVALVEFSRGVIDIDSAEDLTGLAATQQSS